MHSAKGHERNYSTVLVNEGEARKVIGAKEALSIMESFSGIDPASRYRKGGKYNE